MVLIAAFIGRRRLARKHRSEAEQTLAAARAAFITESPRWAR